MKEITAKQVIQIVRDLNKVLMKYDLADFIIWDEDARSLKSVQSFSINGDALQLNAEKETHNE